MSSNHRPRGAVDRARDALVVAGPLAVLATGWLSTTARDTMAIANVALVMAVVTVAVASSNWRAGLATSVVAALSLNYFHTEPVHSLRITAQSDLVSVALLTAIGVAASLATAVRVRAFARDHHHTLAGESRSLLATASSSDRPVSAVWTDAVQAACAEMSLVSCRIEPAHASRLPSIARLASRTDESSRVVLPEGGAVVASRDPRSQVQAVLTPRPGMGSVTLDRQVVFAFVDQLELVLGAPVAAGTSGSRV